MKMLFYVKASDSYGWGHLIRTAKIIEKINKNNSCSVLIEGNENTSHFLKKRKINIFYQIKKNFFSDKSNFEKKLKNLSPEIVFIDMLKINENELKFLKETSRSKIVILSDLGIGYKEANLIICPNPKELWKEKNDKKIVGGLKYVVLPKKKKILLNKGGQKDIFVNTGGTTSKKTFEEMVKKLRFLNTLNFTGSYFLGNVDNFDPHDKKYKITGFEYISGIKPLFKLINKYKVAFVTAGYIRYELIFFKIPMILTSISDHQTLFGKWFKKNEICDFVGPLEKIKLNYLGKRIDHLIKKKRKNTNKKKRIINFDSYAEQRILDLCKNI